MIDLQISKSGVLTTVRAACPSAPIAIMVRQLIARHTSRPIGGGGTLVVSVICARREAGRIEAAIRAMIETAMLGPARQKTPPAASDRRWRHRDIYPADAPVECVAKSVQVGGEIYKFVGLGREFMGREIDGPYWRSPVRYAYYT